MKIHYTASVWHGGFYKFFGNALKSLGHEVKFVSDSGSKSQELARKVIVRIPKFQYLAGDKFREAVSRDWLKSVREFNPDLIILQHVPNILPDAILAAKKTGKKIFYWMDSPPAGEQAKDALISFRFVDKVFSTDRKWMTILFRPKQFVFLPFAGDEKVFHPITQAKKEYDVVFVGSFPEQSGDGCLRAEIISRIPEKYKVKAFGNGLSYWFKFFPNLKERAGVSGLQEDSALNEIYNKSKIVLNIHSTWHTSSLSARTYEIGLAGAFQLVDWREDLDNLFHKGALPSFHYADEVSGLIDKWIRKDEERNDLAIKAREYILEHHTWRHRAEEMLRHLRR